MEIFTNFDPKNGTFFIPNFFAILPNSTKFDRIQSKKGKKVSLKRQNILTLANLTEFEQIWKKNSTREGSTQALGNL
jgi:hypothetical protein